MENFAILTDAGGDFTREVLKKYGIEETPTSTVVWPDGSEKPTDLYYETISVEDYFGLMTNKKNNFSSSIPSPGTIYDRLSALAKDGRNIVVFTISSKMSGGYSAFTSIGKDVMEKYPNIKIEVIDTLRYSGAITLLAVQASLYRSQGLSFDEAVEKLKEYRLHIHQAGFLDDLFFLARKGRLSKGLAFMGNLIGVKPLADLCNETGLSQPIGKAKGYKQVMKIFPQFIEKTIGDCDDLIQFQKVVKLSDKYKWVEHEHCEPVITHTGKRVIKTFYEYPQTKRFTYKCYRVFASRDMKDGRLLKCGGSRGKPEKFGNTPDHCFIDNGSMDGVKVPDQLDREWYIKKAKDRLKAFGITV